MARGVDGRFTSASGDSSFQLDPRGVAVMGGTMQDVINELAEKIAADARADAPVKTGALRDSVGVKKDYAKLKALVIADAPHAGLVHNGTSTGPNHPFSTRANPFVRRAAEKNFENVRSRGD